MGRARTTRTRVAVWRGGRIVQSHTFPAGTNVLDPRIAENGLVAGYLLSNKGRDWQTFEWDGNRVTPLPDGYGNRFRDIDSQGHLVGSDDASRAYHWDGRALIRLATAPTTTAEASVVNDAGRCAGWWTDAAGNQLAVVWNNDQPVELGTLGGVWSRAEAIDDRGRVVGISAAASEAWHAFRWSGGALRDLGTLPAVTQQAVQRSAGMNSSGLVLGTSQIAPSGYTRATLWRLKS
jgi:probable HAF family extracellular repeat protein